MIRSLGKAHLLILFIHGYFFYPFFLSITFLIHPVCLCSTMHLPLWLLFVCDRLLLVYLYLRFCKLCTATPSLPLIPCPFPFFILNTLLFQLANSSLVLPPPPAPCSCSVLFWSHSCANAGTNLCQFILQAEELSVSQAPWVCPAGSLGCFLSLWKVYFWYSLGKQNVGYLVFYPC